MVTSLVAAVPLASAAQDQEPNDSRDDAQQIQIGEQVSGEASTDDEDWFAFTVQAGETINLTATIGKDDGTKFRIRNPSGTALGYPNTKDGSVTAGATARQTGTYYIEVKDADGSSDTYDFTVDDTSIGTITDVQPRLGPDPSASATFNTTNVAPDGSTCWTRAVDPSGATLVVLNVAEAAGSGPSCGETSAICAFAVPERVTLKS
jgi:hypothetical protein